MHLWNDYEGTILAGRWKLGKVLRTEGRSALFAATNGSASGPSPVIRLTEALNDQAVLQARYQAIQAAGETYLVGLKSFGNAELDGTPLSYAVLEPTQESLADILAQRRLVPAETQEVATQVAGGLQALHEQGLVHGLVEPESVLAANDQIKLRSDCARPAPATAEDAALEGAVTAQTDALGLADIIYRSLTQNRLHDAADALALPEPFATIVRNTARGAWGVPEILAELERADRMTAAAQAPTPAAPLMAAGPVDVRASLPVTMPLPAGETSALPAGARTGAAPVTSSPLQQPATPAGTHIAGDALPLGRSTWQQPVGMSATGRRNALLGIGAALLLLLLFLTLHHSAKPTQTASPAGTGGVQSSAILPAPPASTAARTAVPPLAPAKPTPRKAVLPAKSTVASAVPPAHLDVSTAVAPGTKVWRVIAYTYNRRDEAAAKAAFVNRRYPGLDAAIWSRTGSAPFLVTLGASLTEQQAFELRAKARKEGLARDVYAQNYSR